MNAECVALAYAATSDALPRFDQLTGVDWFALIVLAWFLVLGFVRGFVRESMRLCAWIGGLWLGSRFEGELAQFLRRHVESIDAPFDSFVAYALILGAVLVACWLVTRAFQSGLRRLQLQSYDRLLGAVLGAAKGWLVVAVAVVAVAHVPGFDATKDLVNRSYAAQYVGRFVESVRPLFPPSLRRTLDPLMQPAKQAPALDK